MVFYAPSGGGIRSRVQLRIRDLAAALATSVQTANSHTGTVIDFRDLQGAPTELGRFLAQELTDQLVQAGKGLTLLDRTSLEYLMKENNFTQEGLIDPKTQKQYGKMLGLDIIIIGTVTPIGQSVRLNVRALSTETSAIIAIQSTTIQVGNIGEMYHHGLSRSAPGTSPDKRKSDLHDQLRPGSLKFSVKDIDVSSQAGGLISVSYSFENLTGRNLAVAMIHDTASVGPCHGSVVGASALSFLYPNNIAQVSRDLQSGSAAYPAQALRSVASGSKISGSFTLHSPGCAQRLRSPLDVAVSAVASIDRQVITIPLSAAEVSIQNR